MPSIGTSILSVRVKDETIRRLKKVAEEYQTTVPKIIDSFAGVTPDHSGALEAFSMDSVEIDECEGMGIDLVDAMKDNGYPDHEIKRWIDRVKSQLTPYQKSDWA